MDAGSSGDEVGTSDSSEATGASTSTSSSSESDSSSTGEDTGTDAESDSGSEEWGDTGTSGCDLECLPDEVCVEDACWKADDRIIYRASLVQFKPNICQGHLWWRRFYMTSATELGSGTVSEPTFYDCYPGEPTFSGVTLEFRVAPWLREEPYAFAVLSDEAHIDSWDYGWPDGAFGSGGTFDYWEYHPAMAGLPSNEELASGVSILGRDDFGELILTFEPIGRY